MENPLLTEGASFGEIAEQFENQEAPATPETKTEEATGATEGSTSSEAPPEVLGILKEPEEDKEETPDLSVDADVQKFMEGHPVIKNAVEAFMARKEKGVQQFIEKQKAEIAPLSEFKEQYEPLVSFYQEFENPETVDSAFERMRDTLEKTYNRPFGRESAQTQTTTEEGDGKSKYGFEFPSDDKVVDVAVSTLLPQIQKMFDERLGKLDPLLKDHEQTKAEKETLSKAESAAPDLKAEFEVSSDPWVTPEKVAEAIRKYPGLEPRAAFAAHFVKEIAAYTAKHSGTPQTVRNLPQGTRGGGNPPKEPKPGASFEEIAEYHAAKASL